MSNIKHWTRMGRHDMVADVKHDEAARLTVIAHLNSFLSSQVAPQVKARFDNELSPAHEVRCGQEPADRHEVAGLMQSDPTYQVWSTLRRNTMEMRQQTGRSIVLRQAAELADQAESINAGADTLTLNADVEMPDYIESGDQHLMPGGYAAELLEGDVSGPANYDVGHFATVLGTSGPWNDLAGRTLASWVQKTHPDLKPKRILDIGCGSGQNTLPLRAAFPDAEIVALDVAAPMLRYGHARAASLGVTDISFVQAEGTDTGLEAQSFDLIVTSMVLHETSADAVAGFFRESRRLLRDGGLVVHLEQPPYRQFGAFEQFMRDWDGRNNNEPFWTDMHESYLPDNMVEAGFEVSEVFEAEAVAPFFSEDEDAEDFGRAPKWYLVGARLGQDMSDTTIGAPKLRSVS